MDLSANYVTWPELLAAVGVIGTMNMGIFGWLWKRSQAIDDRVTSAFEELEDKQDKNVCLPSHEAFNATNRRIEATLAANGERLVKIETCLEFLVEALREHKKAHEKITGGI